MTTPTNHTTSSLFDFGDLVEPEPSHSSLEQNSSIEESNIFVSIGGEVSGHTRYSGSALSGYNSDQKNNNVLALGPFEEESEVVALDAALAPAETDPLSATAPNDTVAAAGIFKQPKYSNLQHQQEHHKATMIVSTESEMGSEVAENVSRGPQPFSPTIHTSNQTPHGSRANFTTRNGGDDVHSGFQRLDETGDASDNPQREEVPYDEYGAERATAWAIHLALIFFCGLVISCALLTFAVARAYGFLTLVLMTLVITFCGFLACFVDSTILSKNPKLRPVRQKILKVVDATRQMIEDEYQLFLRDWKEEVLTITEGGENSTSNIDPTGETDDIILSATEKKKRRKKSKIFKMVRPFLGLKKKFGKAKKGNQANETSIEDGSMPSYEPPATAVGAV